MYNVAIIVIDTLREDHAQGLEALRELGFVQYHGVAPAPWTLPSHISMITGLMPSQHGVHERKGKETGVEHGKIARLKMHKYNRGIIGELEKLGYHTAIIAANPILSPYFGFTAKTHYVVAPFKPEIDVDKSTLDKVKFMVKNKDFKMLYKKAMIYLRFILFGPTDKGGNKILHYVPRVTSRSPYMLLINIMEAHEPYTRIWNKAKIINMYIDTILNGKCPDKAYKLVKPYNKFADRAAKIAIKIASHLIDQNTLIIITSDHGQGLCDPGFLHGYWLYDGLVKVPLWVKYPKGVNPPPQRRKYISLTEIPALIRYVVTGENTQLGANDACSESFGIGVFTPRELPATIYEPRKNCLKE